ncbi:MAG: hypothetical protein NTW46_00615 [Candidatus Nealsonbacteria bacterium]|nr:hypothetical protein [Candidatus Nealsonbacteria bacterium]
MKNKKEIEYVCCLLKKLKYKCEILFRKKRPGMFSIFIGAKQLKKFYNEIGFGQQNERNDILKLAALKQLRINQYV